MKVLAVGATGPNAGLVVPELLARGVTVRAMVRDDRRAAAARQRGAQETVVADLSDPPSLRAAVDGVDGVFHLNPAFAPDEAGMGVAMVQAAVAAGVGKLVFSSVYHPSLSLTNHADKRPVEEALYASGLDFTILQPAIFMQMLAGLWQSAVEQGVMSQPYSAASLMSYVDYRDVAEVAASAFLGTDLSYGTFELAAGGMLSREDLATMASEILSRPVRTETTALDPSHMPEGPTGDGMARMLTEYDEHGLAGGNDLVLRTLLRRAPRTVHDFFTESAGARPAGSRPRQ
jgi:uncharacterized protein YbjT (DUF2867 family)